MIISGQLGTWEDFKDMLFEKKSASGICIRELIVHYFSIMSQISLTDTHSGSTTDISFETNTLF